MSRVQIPSLAPFSFSTTYKSLPLSYHKKLPQTQPYLTVLVMFEDVGNAQLFSLRCGWKQSKKNIFGLFGNLRISQKAQTPPVPNFFPPKSGLNIPASSSKTYRSLRALFSCGEVLQHFLAIRVRLSGRRSWATTPTFLRFRWWCRQVVDVWSGQWSARIWGHVLNA